MLLRQQSIKACLLLAAINTLFTGHAIAQSESLPPGSLPQIVVVGSRIAQPQDQARPITVITSEQLEQRGYATVQQALDDLAANSGGGFDQQIGLSFTPSAAGLNFRDLGVGRALILLDGHRLPIFPIGWNGTDSFVDLSSIPAGAVQRIEVLADGASAIYGSDAMSGVVNIVLKPKADNEVSLRYGDTTRGGGAEKRVQLSAGTQSGDAHASLFVEYYQREPLWYSQRARTRSDRLGGVNGSGPGLFSSYGFPGTLEGYDPPYPTTAPTACDKSGGSPGLDANGFCQFNIAAYRQVWPEINSLSATAKFDQQINDTLSWFTMLNLRNASTIRHMEPLDFNSLDVGVVLPAGAPNNPTGIDATVYRRLVELGAQQSRYDNQSYNVHAGLKGKWLERFDWQLTLQSARLQLQTTQTGLIRNDQMFDALLGQGDFIGNPLDLSKRISATAAMQIAYSPVSQSESTLNGADFQFSTDLFALPAGPAKLAAVLEHFNESYFDHLDAQIIAGNVSYLKAAMGGGHRGHSGVGLELQLPVLKQWQLNLAGRYDDYQDKSDVGGAVSPRVTLEYRPTRAFVFYGSAGRSFRAPDMQRLFGGQTSGFFQLINTRKCLADGGARRGDASVASCVTPVYVHVATNANLHLQEERGNHYSFGVNWKPSARWSASLDYFSMNLRQLVQTPDGQYVLDQNALNGSFASAVIPFDGDKCPFIQYVCLNLQPLNISYKKVSGIDAAADYQWDAALGTFSAGLKAGYLIDVSMRESALRAPVDVLRNGQLGEAARLKGGIDLGWQRHAWASNIYVSYTSGFTPLDTTTEKHLGSFTTVNCSVRYTLWSGAIAQLGVNNIFDRMPPVDIQRGNLSAPFYHQQFHNVDGASWYASLRQPF